MIRDERLEKITEYVQNRHYASVRELMELLKVSKATVRRDLELLSRSNAVLLTRGGVTCEGKDKNKELAYNEKRSANTLEKNRLGEAAGRLVRSNSTVILDAGTTTRAIVPHIRELTGLNLVTNDLMIAADLNTCEGVNVTVTGGQLRKGFFTLRGYMAADFVRSMRADLAFVGFDALDMRAGCFITNADEVSLKKSIIEAADKVVAVLDHTKFHATAFISVCPLHDIDVVVTDRGLEPDLAQTLREMGIEVILA